MFAIRTGKSSKPRKRKTWNQQRGDNTQERIKGESQNDVSGEEAG